MQNSSGATTGELHLIEQVIDSLLASSDLQEFCKSLIHSEISGDDAQGSQVFLLNSDSELNMIAGYGGNLIVADKPISIWSDYPLGEAIRSKQSTLGDCLQGGDCSVFAIPVLKNHVPLGVLAICYGKKISKPPIENGSAAIVGKLAALYMESAGTGNIAKNGNSSGSPDDLTSRQLSILGFMADGLVNAEIARELLLSESTVRQETVKIYRALGVAGRQEASRKAKALGLISKRLISTPPPVIA
jgi:DNA-binding CsgD family transcriptional regulator